MSRDDGSLVKLDRRLSSGEIAREHRLIADAQSLPNVRALFNRSADKWNILATAESDKARGARLMPAANGNMIPDIITVGQLTIDRSSQSAQIHRQPVRLTPKEFGILEVLASRCGAVVTKAALKEHLYGRSRNDRSRTIDVLICNLRKKLADASGGTKFIWAAGRGSYVLCALPA